MKNFLKENNICAQFEEIEIINSAGGGSNKGRIGYAIVVYGYINDNLLVNFGWGADRNPNTLVDLNGNSFYFENDIKRVNDIYIFKFL